MGWTCLELGGTEGQQHGAAAANPCRTLGPVPSRRPGGYLIESGVQWRVEAVGVGTSRGRLGPSVSSGQYLEGGLQLGVTAVRPSFPGFWPLPLRRAR